MILDPKYARALKRLGPAQLNLGYSKRAHESFGRAIAVARNDVTAVMRKELQDAEVIIEETLDTTRQEKSAAAVQAQGESSGPGLGSPLQASRVPPART
jgi:hypothetical protein